jgi:hypothetical protein
MPQVCEADRCYRFIWCLDACKMQNQRVDTRRRKGTVHCGVYYYVFICRLFKMVWFMSPFKRMLTHFAASDWYIIVMKAR